MPRPKPKRLDKPFDFLGLPGELQTMVYHHAFIKEERYIGAAKPGKVMVSTGFKNEARKFRNLNFVLSCRKVYNEARNMFYTHNGFEFYNLNLLADFLEAIGAAHRALIRKVNISYGTNLTQPQAFKKLRYLLSCISTQSLELEARFLPVDYEHSWCCVRVLNAHDLFFGMATEVFWGHVEFCDDECDRDEECDLDAVVNRIKNQERWLTVCRSLEQALAHITQQRDDASQW